MGKRALEFGMTGIGGGTNLIIDKRYLDGGIGFSSLLIRNRKVFEFGNSFKGSSIGLIRDKIFRFWN